MKNISIYSKENPISFDIFAQLYEILEYSFPDEERSTRSGHLFEFKDPLFRSMVFEDGAVRGFMNYWEFEDFIYLEHFAVARELRGQGLGAKLINELRSIAPNNRIVLEAEPPKQSEIAYRRVRFYERLGFFLNKYTYLQPPYKSNDPPIPLVIMSTERELSHKEFLITRNLIYRNVYELPESSELYR